jgi:hypothetical protein
MPQAQPKITTNIPSRNDKLPSTTKVAMDEKMMQKFSWIKLSWTKQ